MNRRKCFILVTLQYHFALHVSLAHFIPCTVLCGSLFFRPMSKADQSEQEEQFLEKMKQTVLPVLEEKIMANTKELLIPMIQTTLTHTLQDAASLPEMGIIAVKPHLNFAELRDRIVQSKNRIYLCDTWIAYQFNEVERALQGIAQHQVPLRVLLLDPKSPVGKQRAMDLFQDKGRVDHRSKMSMTMLTALYKNAALGNLELRFHSTMPAMQMFICDDRATVGFYFHGQDSQLLPQLEVLIKDEAGHYTSFGKRIEAEFEAKWSLATVAPL